MTKRSDKVAIELQRSPDGSWEVIRAYDFSARPKFFVLGFAHRLDCDCRLYPPGRLCDVGWVEEHVEAIGVRAIFCDPPDRCGICEEIAKAGSESQLRIVGFMCCEEDAEQHDYDEWFHVESAEVLS